MAMVGEIFGICGISFTLLMLRSADMEAEPLNPDLCFKIFFSLVGSLTCFPQWPFQIFAKTLFKSLTFSYGELSALFY